MGENGPLVNSSGWVETVRTLRRSSALRESQFLEQFLDSVPGLIYRFRNDRSSTTEYVSRGCRNLTGYDPFSFLDGDIHLRDLVEPADLEIVQKEILEATGRREPYELLYRIHNRDGETRWVWDRGSGVFDMDGNLTGFEGFMQDVTSQLEVGRSLFRLQRFDSVGRSVKRTVHEFNNIFTGMIGFIDLLHLKHPDNEELAQQLGKIRRLAERAMTANQNLRGSVQDPTSGRTEIDVADLLREFSSLIEQQRPDNVHVSVENHSDRVWVRADPAELEQILWSLSAKAMESMPDGGELVLRLVTPEPKEGNGACCIEIRDTGPGIEGERLRQVRKPSFSSKGKSGTGLTVADAAVRDQGGRIEIDSRPGLGTVMRVLIPTVPPPHAELDLDSDFLLR